MPLHAPEEKPGSTEKTKIQLYVKDRKQIWLHLDNVKWADADDDEDDDIAEYDQQDWHEPIEKLSGSNDGGEEPQIQSANHGDGDGRNEKDEGCGQTLDAEQTNTLIEHSERLRSLHQAKEILRDLGGTGLGLTCTVAEKKNMV